MKILYVPEIGLKPSNPPTAFHHVQPTRRRRLFPREQLGPRGPRWSDVDVGADEGARGGLGQVHLRRREQGRHGGGKLHSAGQSVSWDLLFG